jgi:mannosyltransferase
MPLFGVCTDRMQFIAAITQRVQRRCRSARDSGSGLALPAIVAGLALLLRLWGIGDKPFWLDEIATLRRATATIPALVADSLHNSHYPSYFLLAWAIAKIGTSQALLRLPSAVFGALSAGLTAATARLVAGRRAAIAAGLLMAFSPFEVQFGQEARSYTLVACLILTALWGLVRLAQQPEEAALPLSREGALRTAWAAYAIGTAAALDVLNVAIPWLIASNLAAIAIARAIGFGARGFWRNWALAQLFIIICWAPAAAVLYLISKGTVLDGAAWAPSETAGTLWSIIAPVYLLHLANFITIDLAPAAVPGLSLAVVIMAALGVWRLRRDPPVLAVLGAAALVLPLGLLAISWIVPLLVPRYFAWSAGPFFIFAGVGLSLLTQVRFAAAASALAVLGLVNLIPYYNYETKPRWDLVAKKLAALAHPGDVVLADSYYAYSVLNVFAARKSFDKLQINLTWLLPEAVKVAPGHNVWVVWGRTGQTKKKSPEDYRHSLIALGNPVGVNAIGRYIVMWRYPAPEPAKPAVEPGGYCRWEEKHG